jgi:hypothetical protein
VVVPSETAVRHLASHFPYDDFGEGVVHLDEERKAAMVSSLVVVLSGDRGPTPVVNTGSLERL